MSRNTILALVVCAVLVGAGVLTQSDQWSGGMTAIDFAKIATQAISKIEISGKHQAILTLSSDNKWMVQSRRAEASAMKRVINVLPKIQSTDLVTSQTDRYADYEVDDTSATQVKVFAGTKEILHFWVGKAAAHGGSYIRVGDDVYVAKNLYEATFARNANDWIDKKLFDDKVADVTRVEIAPNTTQRYALVKKDNLWAVEDASLLPPGFRFDAGAASRLVSSLVNFRVKDVLDKDPGVDITGLDDQKGDVFSFQVGTDKPVTRALRVGKTDEEQGIVYVQEAGRSDVMTAFINAIKAIRKAPTQLRDLKIIQIDTTQVIALKVVDGRKQLVLKKKDNDWVIAKSTDKVPDDFVLDQQAIVRRLSSFSGARGIDIANLAPTRAGLNRPKGSLTATLDDGTTVILKFGKPLKHDGQDAVYLSGNIDQAVYVANQYLRTHLLGLLDSLKKKAPAPSSGLGGGFGNLDPAALQKLPPDVRKSLEQQIRQKQQQEAMLKKIQANASAAK